MTKEEAKRQIAAHEYYQWSCGERFTGRSVDVVNVRVLKEAVTADVILRDHEDQLEMRHNDVKYPLSFFV
jgi:hypothetical protein